MATRSPGRSASDPACESIVLIALTGYGQQEDLQRSLQAGFDHHLTKPVDPAAFFSLIATVRGKVHAPMPASLTLARA